jgi:signal transduction histidine kinase
MNSDIPGPPGDILVVDDTPANLQLLTQMLKEKGYKVRPAPNGELALRGALVSPPDLILLDITMPNMDGFEVCARLKADERLRDIPVLFISALNEASNKIHAFEAGGVDYVAKPFNIEEVEARVRTHLELCRRRRELAASLVRMQELERLRDSLTHMIAHDMKSPLNAIQMSLDIVEPLVSGADAGAAKILHSARTSVATIIEMIEQMLDVSRMEAGALKPRLAPGDVAETVRGAVEAQRIIAGARRLSFSAGGPLLTEFDADLLRRVVGNLVGNAIKFTAPDGEIRVSAGNRDGRIVVEVADNGYGIAPEHHAKIFMKFGQVEGGHARVGTGLGLTFARMAVEAHGGAIGLVSELEKGSTFWLTLPLTGLQAAEPPTA